MSSQWLRRLIVLIYVVIGCFIAWDHGYLGLAWLRALASALLAIFLWWLVLLGVNLHVHLRLARRAGHARARRARARGACAAAGGCSAGLPLAGGRP
jgi:hypothetical protein